MLFFSASQAFSQPSRKNNLRSPYLYRNHDGIARMNALDTKCFAKLIREGNNHSDHKPNRNSNQNASDVFTESVQHIEKHKNFPMIDLLWPFDERSLSLTLNRIINKNSPRMPPDIIAYSPIK